MLALYGQCWVTLLSYAPFKQPLEADMEACDEPTQMYRLVLAGDAGAGKSSFLLRLTLNEFRDDIQTTLGACHGKHIFWLNTGTRLSSEI